MRCITSKGPFISYAIQILTRLTPVVYFNQGLVAAHSKHKSKDAFSKFFTQKAEKERKSIKIVAKFNKNVFFEIATECFYNDAIAFICRVTLTHQVNKLAWV